MDQIIKGVLEKKGMDVARFDFKNFCYIYSAKTKVGIEIEDGKVVKVTNERFKMPHM